MVVQLLVFYYVLMPLLGLHMNSVGVALVVFGLNSGAYISEIMRAGILSVDPGQMEGGRSVGLSYGTTMMKIVIPQAIKNCSVFVLILSKNAQKSKWVPRELDQAINENKIVMPFDIDDCALQDDFNFYLTNVQRYNAYQNKSKAIEKMLSEIKAILGVHDNLTSDADEKSGETEFANCVHAEITPALPAEQNAVQAPQKSKSKTKCAKKNKSQKITSEKSSGKKGRAAKGIAIAIAVIAAALVLTIAAASGALSKKVEIGGTKFKANTSSVIIYNKVNITLSVTSICICKAVVFFGENLEAL